MKPDKNPSDEALLADYFVRELTEQELARLESALKNDAKLRAVFTEQSRDEWLLHHVHADMSRDYVKPRYQAVFASNHSNSLAKFVAVAAMLAACCTFIYLYSTHSAIEPVRHTSSAQNTEPKRMATFTDSFTLSGDVISVSNGSETRIVEIGGELFAGDTINVPDGGRMSFQYENEDTFVRINSGAEFSINEKNGAKHIHLDRGVLKAEVVRQPQGKPMRLTTPDAEAVVLGTSFELRAQDHTQLAVLTGIVDFNSLNSKQKVQVEAGHLAKSNAGLKWRSVPFAVKRSQPIFDHTLNKNRLHEFIAVDHERNYIGFLRFDCGKYNGKPIEAKLKLHLSRRHTDGGGSGTVRLFKVPPSTHINNAHEADLVEVATYTGRLGVGMDLIFDIDTAAMDSEINTFLIKLDENGNDFWFSSSEGRVPPQLILKVDSSS